MKKVYLLLIVLLFSSNAWAFPYQPFTFDTQLGDSYYVSQSLGVTGDSVIFTDFTGSYTGQQIGTFTENATFAFPGYASGTGMEFAIDGYDFTATFEAQGNMYSSGTEQWFEFTGGELNMWLHEYDAAGNVNYGTAEDDSSFMGADDGINIATWDLTGGGGGLTTIFAPDDGIISAYFDAEVILPGYIFINGVDASAWDLQSNSPILTLGYAHVTTEDYTPPTLPDPFAKEVWKYLNSGGDYGNTYANDINYTDGFQTLYESHGGGFEIATVPEPATMILFGFGLTGLAFFRRKKA